MPESAFLLSTVRTFTQYDEYLLGETPLPRERCGKPYSRGGVFNLDGSRVFVMGGAASVNRYMLDGGVDWWPDELPGEADFKHAHDTLDANVDERHTLLFNQVVRLGDPVRGPS